jgi:hypothetical protein
MQADDDYVVNYFSYFTDIEQHFVRRRGKHLLVSPLDWALIESWKDMNVPLHIVLRGLDRVFDARDATDRLRPHRINSVLYCHQAVLECFEEFTHSKVGAGEAAADPGRAASLAANAPFSTGAVLSYLSDRVENLTALRPAWESKPCPMGPALGRAVERIDELRSSVETTTPLDLESLEQELGRLEEMIYQALVESVSPEELQQLRAEATRQLRDFKKRMSPEVYEQTAENYTAKRLRENYRIPRLSLFYLQ